MQGLTLSTLHAAYRQGSLRPSEVLEQALERASACPAGVFIHLLVQRARDEAQASDLRWRQGAPLGPLDGAPIVWKDLFDVRGVSTTAGSELRRHAPPALEDAFAVQALTKAGVVNLGKVGLSEYAYSGLGLNPHFGTPPNPLSNDGARVPGGSSSGSAVAVSAGIVPLGMGTDTGGSIRIPAAFQGLVGYRPSSNRLNKSGVYPLSRTLDDIGPIARTVEDCALVDSLLRGQKPSSVMQVAPSGLRMLVPNNLVFDDAEPEVVERFSAMLNRLAKAGVHIKHSEVPAFDELRRLTERHGTIAAAEAYQLHQEIVDGPNAQRIDRRVLARLQRGRSMSALDWLVIQDRRNQLKAELLETLDGAWLLMPTVPHVAPLVATLDADDQMFNQMNLRTLRNTSLGNFFDLCGISLPIGTGKGGMPVGALLSGPPGSDESLFCVAATVAHCLE